jgi:hypothetical protein
MLKISYSIFSTAKSLSYGWLPLQLQQKIEEKEISMAIGCPFMFLSIVCMWFLVMFKSPLAVFAGCPFMFQSIVYMWFLVMFKSPLAVFAGWVLDICVQCQLVVSDWSRLSNSVVSMTVESCNCPGRFPQFLHHFQM